MKENWSDKLDVYIRTAGLATVTLVFGFCLSLVNAVMYAAAAAAAAIVVVVTRVCVTVVFVGFAWFFFALTVAVDIVLSVFLLLWSLPVLLVWLVLLCSLLTNANGCIMLLLPLLRLLTVGVFVCFVAVIILIAVTVDLLLYCRCCYLDCCLFFFSTPIAQV